MEYAWFILAQVFGLIALCFEFCTYQIKEKRKFFVVTGVGSIFWTMMFIFIGLATDLGQQVSTIIAGAFGVIRCAVWWWIYGDSSRKKVGRIILIVCVFIAAAAGVFAIRTVLNGNYPETAWIHIVGLFAAVAFIVGQYLPGKHPVRIAVVFYAVMVIFTQTPMNIPEPGDSLFGLRWNFMGIAIELTKIISVAVFYILLVRRGYIIRKLKEIKGILATELERFGKDDATLAMITDGMPADKLEKLTAKMLRYELAAIERSEITNITTCEKAMATVTDDARQVTEVKELIARLIKYNQHRVDMVPRVGDADQVQKMLTSKSKDEPKDEVKD